MNGRLWRALIALGLGWPILSDAHKCGPVKLEVQAGQCTDWSIWADVDESEPSEYTLPGPPAPPPSGTGVGVSPMKWNVSAFPLRSKNLGVYKVCGGDTNYVTSMTAHWSYAPFTAAGDCTVTITVVGGTELPPTSPPDSGVDGDPVNTATGELFDSFAPDLRLAGPFPLTYQRFYSSALARAGIPRGFIGDGWLDNYRMTLTGDNSAIDIWFLRGQLLRFENQSGSWVLTSPAGGNYQLRLVAGNPVLLDGTSNLRYFFGNEGRLREIRDRNDNTHTVGYEPGVGENEGAIPISVSDGLGRTLTFTVDGFQRYTAVSDGTRTVTFSTSFPDSTTMHLASVTNAAGDTTTFTYADPSTFAPGMLTSWTMPEGNTPLTTAYDSQNRVSTQTDALGNTWTFTYAGSETSITEPGGEVTTHTADARGRLISETLPSGDTQGLGYTNDQRDGVTTRAGQTRLIDRDAETGDVNAYTDELGNTSSIEYTVQTDSDGFTYRMPSAIVTAGGLRMEYAYDANGNLISSTLPDGSIVSMTYNARGQVLTQTTPLGGVTTYTYDANGMRSTATDASGNVTTYTYDGLFRLTQIQHADGSTRSFTYDAMDRRTAITDELGHSLSWQFDRNGRTVQMTDRAGQISTFAWNANDQLSSVTDPMGQVTTQTYDSNGRIFQQVGGSGLTTTYSYDPNGNLTSTTDVAGEVWTATYDAENQLVSSTRPDGGMTSYQLDLSGRLVGVTSPSGNAHTFVLDDDGLELSTTDAAGRSLVSVYEGGQLAGQSLGGLSTAFELNALEDLTSVTDPNGNVWSLSYDSAGRLTAREDPLGRQVTYTYDNRNLFDTITYPGGLGSEAITYDATGRPMLRDFSVGPHMSYTFNALGQITGATQFAAAYDANGSMVASNGLTLGRDAATGNLTSVSYPGGPVVTYTYGLDGRLANLSDALAGSTTFTHDLVGRITAIDYPNGVSSSFTYDADGRLASISHGSFISLSLTRDPSGYITAAAREQPTHFDVATATFTQRADAALQLQGVTHDELGRVTTDGARSYTWDLANRMQSRISGGSQADYIWDDLLHVVSATEAGTTRTYVWNHGTRLPTLATSALDGVAEWHYVSHPGGMVLYRINATDDSRQFYHHDEMGNVLAITDESGTVIASYGYSPYGRRTEAGSVTDNPLTFGGLRSTLSDAADSLYIMGARPYDAARARFLARDRVALQLHPLAFNPYGFAASNPLYFIDPYGDQPRPAEAPDPLTVAGEINTAIGAAATLQGDLAKSAQGKLDQAAKASQAAFSGFARGDTFGAGKLDEALKKELKAQKRVQKLNGKGAKLLGKAGKLAGPISGALEIYKLDQNLDRYEADEQRAIKRAYRAYTRNVNAARRSYKRGIIDFAEMQRRILLANELLQSQIENESLLREISIKLAGYDAAINTIAGLIPEGDKVYNGIKSILGVKID